MPSEQTSLVEQSVALGTAAVIVNSDNLVLMHRRDDVPGIDWPGYWSVLGGDCAPGEHPDTAVVRELEEGAGLDGLDPQPVLEVTDTLGSGRRLTVYRAHWNGNPANLSLGRGRELRWVAPLMLFGLTIPPHIEAALHDPRLGLFLPVEPV